MLDNIITMTDGYKPSHWMQYPSNMEIAHSYLESRGGEWDSTVFFGLQYYLTRYLAGPVVNDWKINLAARRIGRYIGPKVFNEAGWRHIHSAHRGNLPLKIKAVPEGTVVPVGQPMMTVENTCIFDAWLPSYVETLLHKVWYPSTVATKSREAKKIHKKYVEQSGDERALDFRLHDFGGRGVSSEETAAIGGAAHLVNWLGSDTMEALEFLDDYYFEPDAAKTIPASEHSTITAWGQENEVDAYRNMLEKFPNGVIACVSDSYDIDRAVTEIWGNVLRYVVKERNGKLVVRPDSGDPVKVVMQTVARLDTAFGSVKNDKGFYVLHPRIGVIQGDGVDLVVMEEIMMELIKHGYSVDNVTFGMGGNLLQNVNRDTQRFAYKTSLVQIAGEEHEVYKNPVDAPWKASKGGRQDAGMTTVFYNGEVMNRSKFSDVKRRAAL